MDFRITNNIAILTSKINILKLSYNEKEKRYNALLNKVKGMYDYNKSLTEAVIMDIESELICLNAEIADLESNKKDFVSDLEVEAC